jgi:hypothetical protein
MPPGSEPEYGPDQIRRGEQADYDLAGWSIRSRVVDALQIADRWIYGIAHVDATTTAHADGAKTSIRATKTWLLEELRIGRGVIGVDRARIRLAHRVDDFVSHRTAHEIPPDARRTRRTRLSA